MSILIKNGHMIDPVQEINKKMDLLVENGKIVKVASNIKREKAENIIDAANKIVVPGLIDMHTHLREPGREDTETIATGFRAAIRGGFTTVAGMPNTDPPCDNKTHVKFLIEKAEELKKIRLLPIGTMTKGRKGEEMSEMADLKEAGVKAISDDGDSIKNPRLMRRILEYAAMLDLLVIDHAEDKDLSGRGVMHEGYWSTILGLEPIPSVSETVIVERDINLASLAGARLHIAHISAKESVALVRIAKKKGINVTAEVTPHHLSLKDEHIKTYNTNYKVNPPLRSQEDMVALRKALKDGTIDVIATDHAPHIISEKEKEFDYAPFGMIGLETALSLVVKNVVDEGYLSWSGLIEKMAANPARILQIHAGTLKEGYTADITIIAPEEEWIYEEKSIESKANNSPFIGEKMKAKVTDVIAKGKVLMKNGAIL